MRRKVPALVPQRMPIKAIIVPLQALIFCVISPFHRSQAGRAIPRSAALVRLLLIPGQPLSCLRPDIALAAFVSVTLSNRIETCGGSYVFGSLLREPTV